MVEQPKDTTFKICYRGRATPLVANNTSSLIDSLKALNGKLVSVFWVTKGGKRRLKFVDVPEGSGKLVNHLLPEREITEEDFKS